MSRVTSVAELAKGVDLVDIKPTGLSARQGRGPAPAYGEQVEINFNLQIGFARKSADSFLTLFFAVVRVKKSPADPEFARFIYRAFAEYRQRVEATDQLVLDFSRTNGLIHLWPYLRAYVQSASASLGFVPIVLPVFRVGLGGTPGPIGRAPVDDLVRATEGVGGYDKELK
jgi:hypothetical protein